MAIGRNNIENSLNLMGKLLGISRNKEISVIRAEDIDIYGWKRKHFYIMKVIYNIKLIENYPYNSKM